MGIHDPYISLVVAARHDDHGGDFMRRLQIFVNAFVAQCIRHQVPAELIIVEWNPDPNRATLERALQWPQDMSWCAVRIIEVPAATHRRFAHAAAMPLYQMIAKNAGIRRARGEFILATNIDILFNDALMGYFSARRLERQKMYRIDRYDCAADVPLDASVAEQLEYCRTHLLRVNRREGTFPVSPLGDPAFGPADIAAPGLGAACGHGWFAPENPGGEPYRWAGPRAEVVLSGSPPGALVFDLEPGPGQQYRPFLLSAKSDDGALLAREQIRRRQLFRVPIAPGSGAGQRFWLEAAGGGYTLATDPRVLNFRVFQIGRLGEARMASPVHRLFHWYSAAALRTCQSFLTRVLRLPPARAFLDPAPPSGTPGSAGSLLHSNTCGDFSLLHREHWLELRGYPELDCFAMNIDFLFCAAAHHAGFLENVLNEPARIYHIEHGLGSGWTPEGEQALAHRIREKGIPWLDASQVFEWGRQMEAWNTPLLFNLDSWGLRDERLPESVIHWPERFTTNSPGDSV